MTQTSNFALACLAADLERAAVHAKEAHMDAWVGNDIHDAYVAVRLFLKQAQVDETILHKGNGNNESKENRQ